MFDLNELPEGDGFCPTIAKTECEAAPAGAISGSDNLDKICRLLRDNEAAETSKVSASTTFLSPSDSFTVPYPDEDWEAEELARYDAAQIQAAKSPIRRVGAPEVQQGLGAKLWEHIATLPESSTEFGISPRAEKLGQRANVAVEKRSDLTTDFFQRSPGKLDVPHAMDRIGDFVEDIECNLDSRPSLLHTGSASFARKGKRARDDDLLGGQGTLDQSGPKVKRPARCDQTDNLAEVNLDSGPFLSMAVERNAVEVITPTTSTHKSRGKGEVSADEEAATLLSLGDTSFTGLKSDIARAPDSQSLSTVKPAVASSIISINVETSGCREIETSVTTETVDHNVVTGEIDAGKSENEVSVVVQAPDVVTPDQPFWIGQLRGDNFGLTDVAAYCSEQIPPASRLRSLPQVLTVEKVSRLEELFEAVRQGLGEDPIIRVKYPPSPANLEGQSFGCMFQRLRTHKQGTMRAGSIQGELHLGLRNGSADGDMGPPGFTNDDRYVAVVKLKDSKFSSTGQRSPETLYLVLDSVAEAACDTDNQFRKRFEREIIDYGNVEESTLYGILCHPSNRDRSEELCSADGLIPEVASAVKSFPCKDSFQAVQPEATTSKVDVLPEKRSSCLAEGLCVELVDRESHGSVVRTGFVESTAKDLLKCRDNKEITIDSSHEARRSEKSKVRKDDGSRERQRDRERDRESRGKQRERDGRSSMKDVHRHTHRSSEKGRESEPFKRDKSKDKDTDRFKEKERDRHRDSHRELLDMSKRVKELEKEKLDKQREKEREKLRDREKEKERERSLRKRDRLATELDKAKVEEKKSTPDPERPAPGFGPPAPAPGFSPLSPGFPREESFGLGPSTLSGKDIRRRGKIVDEDITFDEKYEFELKSIQPERDLSVSKRSAHSSKTGLLDEKARRREDEDAAVIGIETAADVKKSEVKAMDAQSDLKASNVSASTDVQMAVNLGVTKGKSVSDRPILLSASDGLVQPASEGSRKIHANLKAKMGNFVIREGNKAVESSVRFDVATLGLKGIEGAIDGDFDTQEGFKNLQGRKMLGAKMVQVAELTSTFTKSDVQSRVNVGTSNKLLLSGIVSNLELGRKEGTIPLESSRNDGDISKGLTTKIKETLLPPKAKVALSVRVDNMFDAAQVRKYDDNGRGQQLEPALGSVAKSSQAGPDDAQAAHMTGQYSPTAIDNGSVMPVTSVGNNVTLDFVLQACDKETRVWLVSKTNAVYLADEFGVRILKIEEIPSAKIDPRPKPQGPVNVKVYLATEKSTDANEARWFINQAADMLRAIASRGVLAKCLWYQGPVQRFSCDQAPSVQVVVKKIKGEDGKNLERIQEKTGVMIGIVLDASNKKGIVNSSRVIGLRLKCVRKRGFVEATRQVEDLLAEVAERFPVDIGGGVAGAQGVVLSKLKVDCFSNTSPSSGILTPMQKDVFAAYSPVSPVAAQTPIASFKSKLDEPSIEVQKFSICATAVPSTSHTEFVSAVNQNPPATFEELSAQSQHSMSEDEEPDRALRHADFKSGSRPLYVSNLPSFASAPMLKGLFEEVLKNKYSLPSSYDGVSELVLDINLDHDNHCAFVEFASDELLKFIMKAYSEERKTFCGLKLELGSSASLKSERKFLTGTIEAPCSALEFRGGPQEPVGLTRVRREREIRRTDELAGRFAGVRSSTDSDCEVFPLERRYGSRDPLMRFPGRSLEKPEPLFLTELMRNATAQSIHDLFEDIIKKYINPSFGSFKGRQTVVDVRHIPSRGCAFVHLATPELVDFMLDLHTRKPEVFFLMKLEIGRGPLHGEADEEIEPPPIVKRLNPPNRYGLLPDETTQSYTSAKNQRRQYASISPPRRDMAVMEHDYVDEYDEDEEEDRQQAGLRKRRSDPERTVYADRLPEHASEGMIRRIFERVLREHITEEQRELMGDHLITEVRYVPTKFCAFVVFVGEDLTRLVLQLYNQDEDIFENMRLKPHFHSRMEDLYREDVHEREDGGTHRVLSRDSTLMNRRRTRGVEDYYQNADVNDLGRGRVSTAHRAVAATAFKEVDRRRSVYVDRIPERLPEPKMRDMFDRALRRHPFSTHLVSQVTFFRDKFDPDKLCAFVELETEELVHALLEVYAEDEEAFSGMRVRPAVKYGH